MSPSVGWSQGTPDRTLHIKIERAAGTSVLTMTIRGDKGFLWSGDTDDIGVAFLDTLAYPGFRV